MKVVNTIIVMCAPYVQAVGPSPFSRGERQANSSTASGLKQTNSPRAGTADATPSSSQVKSEVKADGVSSPALDPKLSSEASQEVSVKAEPVSTTLVDSAPAETDAVSVKAETVGMTPEGRPESGEIQKSMLGPDQIGVDQKGADEKGVDHKVDHKVADEKGVDQKGVKALLQTGPGLTVKVKLEAKEEAVGNSPVARPQPQRLRDRYAVLL